MDILGTYCGLNYLLDNGPGTWFYYTHLELSFTLKWRYVVFGKENFMLQWLIEYVSSINL